MEGCPGKGKKGEEEKGRRREEEGGGRGEKKEGRRKGREGEGKGDEREGTVEKEGGAESRQNEEKENGGDMEIDNIVLLEEYKCSGGKCACRWSEGEGMVERTFGKRLSSSMREMMLSGSAASRSRISWLSVNSMCSHLMSSLSYSACRGSHVTSHDVV